MNIAPLSGQVATDLVPWVRGTHSCLAVMVAMNHQTVYCLMVLVIINCNFKTQVFDILNKRNFK